MKEGLQKFLMPKELQKLTGLTLQSRYVVEGNLAGRHRSPLRGASTEFADHRAYIPGDDPKRLDWKVLGRTDRYFVRRYEDETNLRVYMIVDRSASMGYAPVNISKYQYACRLAAAVGYVVLKARDSIGLYLFSNQIDVQMGARNSNQHLNTVLRVLGQHKPANTTNTAQTLHQIAEAIQKRALIVLFSDLFDDAEAIMKALAHFRKQRHDVILFHILDQTELDLSFNRPAEFIDLETNEKLLVDPRGIAPSYRDTMKEFLDKYQAAANNLKIDYRLVNTKQEPETFLKAYLEERKRCS
jgi:uncharacterized protein (DUF58 family)